MNSCYEKDAIEMRSLGWDYIRQLSLMRKVLMFTLKEESHFYYQDPNFEGDSQDDHLWFVSENDRLIARWMKRKGAGTQKESQICHGQFISKIARKSRVLTNDVLRSLSALIYCRYLDTATLRDLINYEGKLIHEDPQPGVLRVGVPRPLRASMQDLCDRICRIEIRQEAIEQIEYMQSYHRDREKVDGRKVLVR
nr:hypothetical protein [Tanacetum cinerariifolium]